MRSREIFLATTILVLLASAGLACWTQSVEAGVRTDEPVEAVAIPAPASGGDVLPAAGVVPVAAAPAAATETHEVAAVARTAGVVRGDIQLAVSALPRIRSIRVELVEARSPTPTHTDLPFRMIQEVPLGRGTPTFRLDDVPFSDYPYVVSVHSPGLNGSSCILTVDARHPEVDAERLRITPGTPLSISVRDQDLTPYVGIEITVLPVGEPAGRQPWKGTTDNGGGLVLDEVLAGDYQILATQNGLPLIEPQTTHVNDGGFGSLRAQCYSLTIERGVPVKVFVFDRNSNPYVGAKVVATATDRVRLTARETETNAIGVAEFAHLQPGTWQVTVTVDKCYLWDQQVTIKPYQDPIRLDARMVPIR